MSFPPEYILNGGTAPSLPYEKICKKVTRLFAQFDNVLKTLLTFSMFAVFGVFKSILPYMSSPLIFKKTFINEYERQGPAPRAFFGQNRN